MLTATRPNWAGSPKQGALDLIGSAPPRGLLDAYQRIPELIVDGILGDVPVLRPGRHVPHGRDLTTPGAVQVQVDSTSLQSGPFGKYGNLLQIGVREVAPGLMDILDVVRGWTALARLIETVVLAAWVLDSSHHGNARSAGRPATPDAARAAHLFAHRLPLIRRPALVTSRWRVARVFLPLVPGCLAGRFGSRCSRASALVALLLLWRSVVIVWLPTREVVAFRLGLVESSFLCWPCFAIVSHLLSCCAYSGYAVNPSCSCVSAGLTTLLVDGPRGSLLGLVLGDASIFVRVLDVLVLTLALAAFLRTSWHLEPPCRC